MALAGDEGLEKCYYC